MIGVFVYVFVCVFVYVCLCVCLCDLFAFAVFAVVGKQQVCVLSWRPKKEAQFSISQYC